MIVVWYAVTSLGTTYEVLKLRKVLFGSFQLTVCLGTTYEVLKLHDNSWVSSSVQPSLGTTYEVLKLTGWQKDVYEGTGLRTTYEVLKLVGVFMPLVESFQFKNYL